MELSTVNVIEYADGAVLSVRSFNDNGKGNKEAEKLFKSIIEARDDKEVTPALIDAYTEDGIYEDGDYQLFLTHSS